jgi:tetratricopeptide (TPR) repeat protein
MQVERGEALASLQTLEGFRSAYPKSPAIPQVRKALAEAYMILHKYDDATAEYQAIIKDFPGSDDAREARYRLGDVLFAKGDDSGAVVAYEAAIKEYPAQEKIYPNADFNMAEARFLQKDYKKSLNGYVQFVELYPTHEYGGYALTRIGELLGILGADQRREMGAYLESYFRFPDHPGAKVARIRMLSRQMRGMKETEEKHALAEIRKYADQLDVPGIKEFTTLMTAEGLANRGEYTAALQDLIAFYQKNPGSTNLTTFKGRILRNIANQMKALVDKGDFIQALKFHSLYSNTWLKNTDRIDIPYLLAGAYERAGAYSEAEEIYKKDLKRRKAIVGTDEEKEKKVQEHLPSVDELSLRVAATMFQDRDYHGAYERLKAMGKTPELTPAEVIERVRLSASIAEQRNDPERARAALLELADKWQGDPALLAPVNLQLAQTLMKLGDAKRAETYADRVLQVEGAGTEVPGKTVADAYTVKGEAQLAQKKPMAAVETYQKLLERFESKMPLAKVRYEVGQILFDRGDLKGAADVWRRLEGTPGEFLAKVGKEKLADSEWREQYKKYINRFPAMAKGGTKGSQP